MTSLPISTLKDAVFDYIAAATGIDEEQIVFAYNGGTEPQGSYVSIIPVISVGRMGPFDEQIMQTNGDTKIVHRRSVTMQIECYGPDALELVTQIYDAIDVSTIYANFSDSDLTAMFSSNIRDLSAVKNIRYEQRYNIDLAVHATYTSTVLADDIGWFDSIRLKDSILGTPDNIITGD